MAFFSSIDTLPFAIAVGSLLAIAATVLLYIFIIPEKRGATLPKFGKFLHNLFTFKDLMLEKILGFLYTLSTVSCVCIGFMMIFGFYYYNYGYPDIYSHWYGLEGILIMIAGPIALRIAFEIVMMFILLVKNVIQINQKLDAKTNDTSAE